VVDSEDIPLNISRENMQDSALIGRINNVLTKKLIAYFAEEAKKDETKYLEFFSEFDTFIKEVISALVHCFDSQTKKTRCSKLPANSNHPHLARASAPTTSTRRKSLASCATKLLWMRMALPSPSPSTTTYRE
jgi:HSP90 family molecular chaperone